MRTMIYVEQINEINSSLPESTLLVFGRYRRSTNKLNGRTSLMAVEIVRTLLA